MIHRASFLLSCALVASAGPASAQTTACVDRTASVSLLTPPDHELALDDFSDASKKSLAKIASIDVDASPKQVVVLLDSSGSVSGTPALWRAYITLATKIIEAMPEGSSAAIGWFQDQPHIVTRLSQDRAALRSSLMSMQTPRRGSTALWDAIIAATNVFAADSREDVVYVLTDGDDDASRLTAKDAEKTLVSKGIKVFSISIDLTDAKWPDNLSRKSWLNFEKVVTASGGTAIMITGVQKKPFMRDKSENLTDAGRAVLAFADSTPRFYVLRIEPAGKPSEPVPFELWMNTPEKNGIRLSYNFTSLPCSSSASDASAAAPPAR